MNVLFEVSDRKELLALHRALMEARFHPDPEQPELAGSPFIAAMSHRVVDALASEDRPKWDAWRKAESHRHRFPVVLSRIAEANAWPGWTDTQKHDFVELLLAPFRAEPTTVAELVEEGDRLHREK